MGFNFHAIQIHAYVIGMRVSQKSYLVIVGAHPLKWEYHVTTIIPTMVVF